MGESGLSIVCIGFVQIGERLEQHNDPDTGRHPTLTAANDRCLRRFRCTGSYCCLLVVVCTPKSVQVGLGCTRSSRRDKTRVAFIVRVSVGPGHKIKILSHIVSPIFVPRTSSIVHAHFPWGRRLSRAVLCCHARTSGPPWPGVLYDTLRSGRTRDSLGKCGTSHFIHIGFFCPTSKQLPSLQPLPPPTCTPGARGAQPPSHTCHRCAARACQCSRPRARRWP